MGKVWAKGEFLQRKNTTIACLIVRKELILYYWKLYI